MDPNRPKVFKVAALIETSTAYGRGLLLGIAQYARTRNDWALSLKPRGKDGFLLDISKKNADGLLVRVHDRQLAARVLRTGVPTVDLGYVIPDLFPWRIANDQRRIGAEGAHHLLDCGLRSFGFCGWGPLHPPARIYEHDRLESFAAVLHQAGFKVENYEGHRRPDRTGRSDQRLLASWLRSLPKPVGIMAANDERALELLEAAQSAGIHVPSQAAILGVDNDEIICQASHPTLSSVALNLQRIGWEGAGILDRLLRGQPPPDKPLIIPPFGVVRRQSTDVIAVHDELVADAVRLIQRRLSEPLQVNDLLKALQISRRTLEVRFRAVLGRTPHDELIRRRIQHVKDLLLNTGWTLKQIANQAGFRHVEHLHHAFRRAVGQTPGAFRQQIAGIRGQFASTPRNV